MNSIKELKEQLGYEEIGLVIHLHFTVPNAESAAFTGGYSLIPERSV